MLRLRSFNCTLLPVQQYQHNKSSQGHGDVIKAAVVVFSVAQLCSLSGRCGAAGCFVRAYICLEPNKIRVHHSNLVVVLVRALATDDQHAENSEFEFEFEIKKHGPKVSVLREDFAMRNVMRMSATLFFHSLLLRYLHLQPTVAMLFSSQSVLVLCARSVKTTTRGRRIPIAVSAVQWFSASSSTAKPPNKTERGILFSAPCLDPDIRERLALAAEEHLAASIASAVEIKPAKVEKGFLFSAPCLEMNRDGELSRPSQSKKVVVDVNR
jgi:hypothetical protein